ncbi:MAG: RteC domain-containing protein [Cyclobacteriaceae bacterium]
MDNTYQELLYELERSLHEIENATTSKIEKCSKKLSHCQLLIRQLRDAYLSKLSNDKIGDVDFFKVIKPKFSSELQFQTLLFNYYKSNPRGSLKLKKQYLNECLERESQFISLHSEFYQYTLIGETHLDHIYFERIDYDLRIHSGLEFPTDLAFSSPADLTLSKLESSQRFIQFLKNELHALKNPTLDPSWEFTRNLNWNGSKTDLIELVYALTAAKAIDAELKDTIQLLEKIFNVDLGNFYRTYTDIKLKRNPASFLDELKTNLLEKIRKENG